MLSFSISYWDLIKFPYIAYRPPLKEWVGGETGPKTGWRQGDFDFVKHRTTALCPWAWNTLRSQGYGLHGWMDGWMVFFLWMKWNYSPCGWFFVFSKFWKKLFSPSCGRKWSFLSCGWKSFVMDESILFVDDFIGTSLLHPSGYRHKKAAQGGWGWVAYN